MQLMNKRIICVIPNWIIKIVEDYCLADGSKLKWVQTWSAGVNSLPLELLQSHNILITSANGVHSYPISETIFALMLGLTRKIHTYVKNQQAKIWHHANLGLEIHEKTIGIIGLGAIGKQLAKRLSAFNCHIIAHEPYPDTNFVDQYHIDLVDLSLLISNSDFISLHVPVLPKTRGMVNDSFIAAMKEGAFLINTSRGEILDETALIKGLESGHIRGAALDAFEKEPPNPYNPLLSFDQVICTPHLGAQADGSTNNMGYMALNECIRVLQGESPKYQVN